MTDQTTANPPGWPVAREDATWTADDADAIGRAGDMIQAAMFPNLAPVRDGASAPISARETVDLIAGARAELDAVLARVATVPAGTADTAALRALAASSLGTALIGSVAEATPDDGGDRVEWIALKGADGGYWWDVHGDDESLPTTDTIAHAGARLIKVPVGVEDLAALLDAAEERDRLETELTTTTVDLGRMQGLFGAQFQESMGLADQLVETGAERDRARDAAAALEAENAELRRTLTAIRDRGACAVCNSDDAARGVLARTDPLRADR